MKPRKYAVARNSEGKIGMITNSEMTWVWTGAEVTNHKAWTGICLFGSSVGHVWSSRNPKVLFYLDEKVIEERKNARIEIG